MRIFSAAGRHCGGNAGYSFSPVFVQCLVLVGSSFSLRAILRESPPPGHIGGIYVHLLLVFSFGGSFSLGAPSLFLVSDIG